MRLSNSQSSATRVPGMSGIQQTLSFVAFTSPASLRVARTSSMAPEGPVTTSSMTMLPQRISVTSSPLTKEAASSPSTNTRLALYMALVPASAFLGWRGTLKASGSSGAPAMTTGTLPSSLIPKKRWAMGSTTFLFMAQNLSHSISTSFLEAPCAMMKSCRACTCTPRRSTPWTVGKRGSFQPSTMPLSANQVSLRLERVVKMKLRRENSMMFTWRTPSMPWRMWYCGSLSRYSVVRMAWVTPSMASTMGHAKS
mmetsp:Transcript_1242/g.4872  ORF Transcript_1242/g.4872 Transcript_1242/m.4872 type:complete len:254 (-) Transcript_1242:473-1234(-)